jgi:Lipase C-terminal domain/Alpha/beta hydrolase family
MRHKRSGMAGKSLRLGVLAVVVATGAAVPSVSAPAGEGGGGNGGDGSDPRPVIFVHGFSGSGAQFETQAKRFTSNGYPPELIELHEYDSGFGLETEEDVYTRLDERIARLLADSGADQVDLLGHSLGTRLMQAYLRSSPERAATVAHYVNLDGFASADPPGGVPTLAVWGVGDPGREIGGAENVSFPNQTHTQVVTSPQTFEEIYRFFNDEAPETTRITPQRRVELSGRAVLFPQNAGVDGGELEIYEVDADSGERVADAPDETFPLEGDGEWGPFEADGRKRYEFAIVRPGAATHHLYFEPFIRSDSWVRLLTSPVEGGIGGLLNVSDDHSGMVLVRYKEWWGDQGDRNDVLEVNGEDILNATNTPIDKRAIGIFAFDEETDGATDLSAPMANFAGLPFITGVDLFIPASGSETPDDTISVVSTPRGGGGKEVSLNVPNWTSSTDRISVQFSDHLQGAR